MTSEGLITEVTYRMQCFSCNHFWDVIVETPSSYYENEDESLPSPDEHCPKCKLMESSITGVGFGYERA